MCFSLTTCSDSSVIHKGYRERHDFFFFTLMDQGDMFSREKKMGRFCEDGKNGR